MSTTFSVCVTLDGVDDDPDDVITIASDNPNDALATAVAAHLHNAAVAGRQVKAVGATIFASMPARDPNAAPVDPAAPGTSGNVGEAPRPGNGEGVTVPETIAAGDVGDASAVLGVVDPPA